MRKLMTLFLILPSLASAADCKDYLQGFTEWEMKVKGKMEPQTDFFEIRKWSPDSQFDGVALAPHEAKNLKKPVLEVEFKAHNKAKVKMETFSALTPLPADPNYLVFSEFKPREFFTFAKSGTFELRLKDADNLLCTSSHIYEIGH